MLMDKKVIDEFLKNNQVFSDIVIDNKFVIN